VRHEEGTTRCYPLLVYSSVTADGIGYFLASLQAPYRNINIARCSSRAWSRIPRTCEADTS
jgi:hypothetical protein